jgi:hypothetical protein
MRRKKKAQLLGVDMSVWANRALSAVGLSTIIYGLVRYTFIGEFFERLYRDTLGHSPIDDLVDSFDPREDIRTMKDDMRMIKDAL